MTIPARRDPAAEALQLAAIRRDEGMYRGHELAYGADKLWRVNGQPWALPTAAAARRAVDELLSATPARNHQGVKA